MNPRERVGAIVYGFPRKRAKYKRREDRAIPGPRAARRLARHGPALRHLLLVDVVADHAPEDTTDSRADDAALDLVAARDRADHRTGARANGRITLRVLHDVTGARRRGCNGTAARAGTSTAAAMRRRVMRFRAR